MKMAFSGLLGAETIAQNRPMTRIFRQINDLRLHTKNAVIYTLTVLISKQASLRASAKIKKQADQAIS